MSLLDDSWFEQLTPQTQLSKPPSGPEILLAIERAKRIMRPITVVGHADDIKMLREAYDWESNRHVELRESSFATRGKLMIYDPSKADPYDMKLDLPGSA